MNKFLPINHLDNLLRDRYKKHMIPPEEELWKGINSRMNQRKLILYFKKIQRLRIAVTILAFALIGTLILFVTDLVKQENPITDSIKQEIAIPVLPADTISEKPLNSVRKVVLSDQEEEQDIQETDSCSNNDDPAVILSK